MVATKTTRRKRTSTWRDQHVDWREAVKNVPTEDYLVGHDLTDAFQRHIAVGDLVYLLESERWVTWEAVIRSEQGLLLSERHEELLDELLDFGDRDGDERILYLNDSARPAEPWYGTVRRLAQSLLVERYDTATTLTDGLLDDGARLCAAAIEHGEHLSLPPGCSRVEDAIGADLRHRLVLQGSLTALTYVGTTREELLENVSWFLQDLKHALASVIALNASLEQILAPLVMPSAWRHALITVLCERLDVPAADEPIAYPLDIFDPHEAEWDPSWPNPFEP